MTEPSEFDELLKRCQEGDEQAIAKLFQEYAPSVERFVRFRLRLSRTSRISVRDLAQSTMRRFLGALRSEEDFLTKFSSSTDILNYMFETARRHAIELTRKNSREPLGDKECEMPSPNAERHTGDSVSEQALHLALQELPEEHRSLVLDYLYIEDVRKIAEKYSKSYASVQKQLHRLKERLKDRCEYHAQRIKKSGEY